MCDLLNMLLGGDLRSEGRAEEVAQAVIEDPQRLREMKTGLRSDENLLRARTCMALEIISQTRIDLLDPITPLLISTASDETVAQARWHLAEIFGRIRLNQEQSLQVADILRGYLEDKSKIVLYCSIDALLGLDLPDGQRERINSLILALKGTSKSIDKRIAQIE